MRDFLVTQRLAYARCSSYPMMLRSAASPGSWGWSAGSQIIHGSSCHDAHRSTPYQAPRLRVAALFLCASVTALSTRHANGDQPDRQSKGRGPKAHALGECPKIRNYLILVSLNSTCFLTTGSYFVLVILSVMVRLFLVVT